MLTQGQQKYLSTLDNSRIAKVVPFDPKCLQTGREIENRLRELLKSSRIIYIGSSVLEIAGENDIDISVVSGEGFENDLMIMKNEFGEPMELKSERQYAKWSFISNGFEIELYLNGYLSQVLEEQVRTHQILENSLKLRKEYEQLKLSCNGILWKEYMAKKMEFFNGVLEMSGR